MTVADLDAIVSDAVAKPPRADDRTLVMVVAKRYADSRVDRAAEYLGVMWDFNGPRRRRAFAIFDEPHQSSKELEEFLTAAHELTHIFNIHHSDWCCPDTGAWDRDSTIEGYSNADTGVKFRLSAHTVEHLKTHPLLEVFPGPDAWPYGTLTAHHLFTHQATPDEGATNSSLRLLTPGQGSFSVAFPKREYVVGEPVIAVASVVPSLTANGGNALPPDTSTGAITVVIEPLTPRRQPFVFVPGVHVDARPSVGQQPQILHAVVQFSFGSGGWSFAAPGRYKIRAIYKGGPSSLGSSALSDETVITIREPSTRQESLAATLMANDNVGMILAMDGGLHLTAGTEALRRVVGECPTTPHASVARVLLARSVLLGLAELPSGHPAAQRLFSDLRGLLANIRDTGLPTRLLINTELLWATELDRHGRMGDGDAVRLRIGRMAKSIADSDAVALLDDPAPPPQVYRLLFGPASIPRHYSANPYPKFIQAGDAYLLTMRGMSLWTIAEHTMGGGREWTRLQSLSGYFRNPAMIYPGDPIIIKRQ